MPPPRPADERGLGFQARPMVRWFDFGVLLDSVLRVVISGLFGAYADKRELQAAIEPPPHRYAAGQDGALWIDFVADLGDGFDSTYAIASLLGRERLRVAGDQGELELPRGRLLVMGGDQVYPSATREDYENRFRGPYAAALPWTPPAQGPHLFAIPGNHDWYDGLTHFMRFFCAGRRIGGWQTAQRRSYYAISLPHRWWLLGLDIQLDAYIDEPQMEYFRGVELRPGDRVILVTGRPSWVFVERDEVPDSYKNLRYFKDKVIAPSGARVAVTLTGDLHHYCRYEAEDDTQLVTSGGGGAFLFPTHTMPAELELPEQPSRFRRAARWPPAAESERLAPGALRLPLLAPGLCGLLAGVHASFAASLFAALDAGTGYAVLAILAGLFMFGALYAFAAADGKLGRFLRGGAHAAAQLAPAGAIALFAELALGADGASSTLAVFLSAAAVGYVLGGLVFAAYLIATHRRVHKHANELYSCQSIPDWKNFLRLRIDEQGLTLHAIGVEQVPRDWQFAPDADPGDPWLEPADAPLAPRLVDGPVRVAGPAPQSTP